METSSSPRIRYLDGPRFRRALIAGATQVMNNRDLLNAINVFPVADGDTGTNMAGTLGFIVDGIIPSRERAIHRMLRAVADLALSGARGCSGTILAQFLHGLARELRSAASVTTHAFGMGVRKAVVYPYEAVSEPREGTILTVLRDWGNTVFEWSAHTDDFVDLLHNACQVARRSLEKTREQLAILTLAGVVDAGAQGLVHILEGITGFIAGGRIRELDRLGAVKWQGEEIPAEVVQDPINRYCAQLVVDGSDMEVGEMRRELAGLGDSLIVAGSAERSRIHIHSNEPAQVFARVAGHGTVTSQRIEDMRAQFRAAHTEHGDIAIVVDSSCDLPPDAWERHTFHVVPCLIMLGGRTYLDKLSMTPEVLFPLLRASRRYRPQAYATTSQPPPAEFKGRYDFLLGHYSSVISLSISAAISGTFDSARSAARMSGGNVEVIDTKSTSIGLGLLARRAAEAVDRGATRDEVIALVNKLIPRVRIHLTVTSLEGLIRSGRVSRVKGLLANLLRLKPLIRLDAGTGGKPVQGATVFGVKGGRKKILGIVRKEIDPRLPTEFAIAHVNARHDAEWLAERIQERFTLARKIFIVQATSVLAAHIGEGAVGLAYIVPEP